MAISKKIMEYLKMARAADICDAMDSMGLQDTYEMSMNMRPLFPGIRFCGTACTQEWERTDRKVPYMSYEDFEVKQYAKIEEGGYGAYDKPGVPPVDIKAGDVVVIDAHGLRGGILGSENTMNMMNQGVVGFVIDGQMRDTPEAIMQGSTVFSTHVSYTHPMGRIRIKSANEPIVCDGVRVCPGDAVIADHDGVIVVPQQYADEIAYRAYKIQQIDRRNRRANYEKAGREFDATVELMPDIDRWF